MIQLTNYLNTPGEHAFVVTTDEGQLEGVLTVPEMTRTDHIALIGHPHSLQGGTMNNKVVTTLVRVFKECLLPSIRFNFRGVGRSSGQYDDGIGESEDMLHLARLWQESHPEAQIIFAGFSFGSFVAYRAAARQSHALLITIAPSVEHYNYAEFSKAPCPWVVVQGDRDEIVPLNSVVDFANKWGLSVLRFPESGHFFHGHLIELKLRLLAEVRAKVPLL